MGELFHEGSQAGSSAPSVSSVSAAPSAQVDSGAQGSVVTPLRPDAPTGADAGDVQPSWFAHYSAGVPHTVDIPEQPLPWLVDQAARTASGTTAIAYYGTYITYAQFAALVDRFAHALVKMGVKRGDRVSLCLPNIPQFPIAFYGALKAGAVVVPTNPLYTKPELEHQLNDAQVKVAVVVDLAYPTLAAVRARTPVEHVILAGVADYFPLPLALAYKVRTARDNRGKPHTDMRALRSDPTIHQFKQVIGASHDRQGFEVFALPAPANPDDLAVLQYTGGTTGVAKGAMLSHRNLLANAVQCWAWSEQPPNVTHRTLCVTPFFHVYGLTIGMNMTVLAGSTMVLLPRFTVDDTLKAIERYKTDLFPGVPTMYLALARAAEQKPRNLQSIKVCISGSAPLPLEVQRRFEAVTGGKVVEGYGLTESSPVTHCNPVYGDRRIGTIGLPLPNTESAIINPDSWEPMPVGERGEIAVRGPQIMQGYLNRADETAKVLHDGWLRTGDIGMMNDEGYFTIVDRAKDLIIASGYNIFPREVEEVLFEQPKVLEAVVIGVPDEYRGETVRAYIVPKPGETLTADEMRAFVNERLAVYKQPKEYVFRESLPKTFVGKVLRRELREQAIAERAPTPSPSPTGRGE